MKELFKTLYPWLLLNERDENGLMKLNSDAPEEMKELYKVYLKQKAEELETGIIID